MPSSHGQATDEEKLEALNNQFQGTNSKWNEIFEKSNQLHRGEPTKVGADPTLEGLLQQNQEDEAAKQKQQQGQQPLQQQPPSSPALQSDQDPLLDSILGDLGNQTNPGQAASAPPPQTEQHQPSPTAEDPLNEILSQQGADEQAKNVQLDQLQKQEPQSDSVSDQNELDQQEFSSQPATSQQQAANSEASMQCDDGGGADSSGDSGLSFSQENPLSSPSSDGQPDGWGGTMGSSGSARDWRDLSTPDSVAEHCWGPPTADAGSNQQVKSGTKSITLYGSAQDIGDQNPPQTLKYSWTKLKGPGYIRLDNPQSEKPSFMLPTFQPTAQFSVNEHTTTFQLKVTDSDGNTDTDTVDISPSCPTIGENVQSYNTAPWNFKYSVVNKEGLVLRDINAGKQHLFDSISVPQFRIETADGLDQVLRFCDPDEYGRGGTPMSFTVPKVVSDTDRGIDTLQWQAVMYVGKNIEESEEEIERIKGELTVDFEIVIRHNLVKNCEAGENRCYRFIPKVSYNWIGEGAGQQKLTKFTAYYKLDYGSGTALTSTRDSNYFPLFFFSDLGKQRIVTHETSFNALTKGAPGKIDNIHTAHARQSVNIPGCRMTLFDCVHMHWKWSEIVTGKKVDPMVEPSTDEPFNELQRGVAYLTAGQTIDISIVKYNEDKKERYPFDPTDLVNNEQIATATDTPSCLQCVAFTAGHPVVWYVASIDNQNSWDFFRHGLFVLNAAPAE